MAERKVFLFTDLESSTRRWETDEEAMSSALARHDAIVAEAIARHHGQLFKHTGDGVCAAFDSGREAVAAASAIQASLHGDEMLSVRIGIHAGDAESRKDDWFGSTLNRCARLMGAAHGGQTVVSGEVAGTADVSVVLRDLGEHRLRDLGEPMRVFQVGTEQFPALRSLSTKPTNLPAQRSSFVGRERELARLVEQMETSRLVTLIGVGGTGKTRLALHAAADASVRFNDGTFLVELASLRDPLEVPRAMAEAVGAFDALTEAGSDNAAAAAAAATERLLAWVAPRSVLVVVDNCEHLIGAVARVADQILAAGKEVNLLATSREPLMIEGERIFPVPGLEDSAALFEDRARAVRPDFRLTPANRSDVEALCARLDGIPLAVELAAARLSALSLSQISQRLDDTFRLLTGGSRTALERQQTLAGTIRWSYDLLTSAERSLFVQLGVFVGGCSLDAIEQVCRSERGGDDLVDLVRQLVDKSLLVFDDAGDGRYRMLEVVRQFAAALLAESEDAKEVRDRHLRWAVRVSRPIAKVVSVNWPYRSTLTPEHDNLAQAYRWAIEGKRVKHALELAATTSIYWRSIGMALTGVSWLEQALQVDADDEPVLRAFASIALVNLRQLYGDYIATAGGYEAAAETFEALDFPVGRAYALFGGARALDITGHTAQASALYDEVYELFTQLGDEVGLGWAVLNRGAETFMRGDCATAAEVVAPLVGRDPAVTGLEPHAGALVVDGLSRMTAGDVEAGRAQYRHGLEIVQENVVEHAYFSYLAATVELEPGMQRDHGELLLRQSLDGSRRAGALEVMHGQLEAAAVVAFDRGDLRAAAALFAAACGLPARTGIAVGGRQRWEPALLAASEVQATLGEAELTRAEARGRAWSLSEAVEAALAILEPV